MQSITEKCMALFIPGTTAKSMTICYTFITANMHTPMNCIKWRQ